MNVFVSGSTNPKIDKKYLAGYDKIADYFAKHNIESIIVASVYGAIGEMYKLLNERGAKVRGLSPKVYASENVGMDLTNYKVVENLYELQQEFIDFSDITLVIAGGNGTLAELFMFTDLIKSKYTTNPVIIYNVNGIYSVIRDYLDWLLKIHTLEQFQRDFFVFCDTPEDVIKELEKHRKKIDKAIKK